MVASRREGSTPIPRKTSPRGRGKVYDSHSGTLRGDGGGREPVRGLERRGSLSLPRGWLLAAGVPTVTCAVSPFTGGKGFCTSRATRPSQELRGEGAGRSRSSSEEEPESTGSGSRDACPTPGDSSHAAPWTAAALSRGLRAFRAHSPHQAGHGPCVTGLALFKLVDVSAKKLAESPMTVSKGGGHCPHELPSHAAVPWPPAWMREGAELTLATQPLCTQRAPGPESSASHARSCGTKPCDGIHFPGACDSGCSMGPRAPGDLAPSLGQCSVGRTVAEK